MIQKLKKSGNAGFTLAELLIVVAIIAVLVAIMIPTFTKSADDAQVAADLANIRASYAEAKVDILNADGTIKDSGVGSTFTTKTALDFSDATVRGKLPTGLTNTTNLAAGTYKVTCTSTGWTIGA